MLIENWWRGGERLRRMHREELLDRSRQSLAKRCDGALAWFGYDFAKGARIAKHQAPGKFFFTAESIETILVLLRQRLPGRAEQIVEEADKICEHRFDLLGYTSVCCGNPVDWHSDAVHGRRAPKEVFYRVRYLNFAQCGDSRITWELNRHQHFVTLAKAYRLTSDRRYVEEIFCQKRHWEKENPYPIGINWVSSLEVAFRSLSWLWTYHLLCGRPDFPELRREWLPGLAVHGRHIERYLSTYFSPNTHLLGEAVALFFLGILCPELPNAERWKSKGWEIVLQEAAHQVRDDGVHFEQSTYYHVYALDFCLHASVLATVNNIPRPRQLDEKIEQMLTALSLLGRHGPPPQFGDDDGGRLFDPRRNRSEHFLDPLSTGAILFSRGDCKNVAGALREETLWLLGEDGVRHWDSLEPVGISTSSTALPGAGYYLLTAEQAQLIVDAGPLGAHRGGHGHADALSVCLQSQGHSLLVDPGTFEYVGPGGERNLFRGTRMHNTLQVDGLDQAETGNVFSWGRFTNSTVEQWVQGQSFDMLIAKHDGYQRLQLPVIHRRWVISLRNGAFLVRDVVEGSGVHRIGIAWHLGEDLELIEEGVFGVRGADRQLTFLSDRPPGWKQQIDRAIWSPAYGRKAATTVLQFSAETVLPVEFAVMLISSKGGKASFRRMDQPSGSAISKYEYVTHEANYLFAFNETGKAWRSDLLSSDAKFVWHKRDRATSDAQLIFSIGTQATLLGEMELLCVRPVEWAELKTGSTCAVSCSDKSAVLAREPSGSVLKPSLCNAG